MINGDIFIGFSYIVPFMVTTIFIIVIGAFIFSAIKGISTWNKNNNSPRLNVSAELVSKRISVSHRANANNTGSTSHTRYYVTFQVDSGDRMEFNISGKEYGLLAERDKGELTFQGTRYISFERNI